MVVIATTPAIPLLVDRGTLTGVKEDVTVAAVVLVTKLVAKFCQYLQFLAGVARPRAALQLVRVMAFLEVV